jgi:hypothetical protein
MTTYAYDAQALVPTAAKTSAYTAAVNDLVIVDGTSSSVVITLPTAPPNLSTVGVKRYDATYTSANIPTVARGGSDAFLGGGTTAFQLPLQGQAVIFQYSAGTAQWLVRSTDEPLSGLDLRYLNQNTTGNAGGITGKTTPTGALVGTSDTQALTNKDLTGSGNTFPTLNQNTTGTAAGITGKSTPTGSLVGTSDTQVLTNKDLTGAGNTFPTLNQGTTGNAATATKLATARNINGVAFDGSAAVTVPDGTNSIFTPADYGWIAWSGDPMAQYTGIAPTNGYAYFTMIPVRSACTITNILMAVTTVGASMVSGENFAGLFNTSGTLLSATADQSSTWAGTTGLKTMALTTPQSVSAGLYYVAFFTNGTTIPKFSYNAAQVSIYGGNSGTYPRFGLDTAHSGLTTAFHSPATIISSSTSLFWAGVS